MSKKIYIMDNGTALKLGVSDDPERRAKQVAGSGPVPVEIKHEHEHQDALFVEKRAHKILADKRLQGEWFDVTLDEAVTAIKVATEAHRCRRCKPKPLKRKVFRSRPRPSRKNLIPQAEIERIIQSARAGRVVEFQNLNDVAATTSERVEIVCEIFKRGASIKVDDVVVKPEQADILIVGMESRRRFLDPDVAASRGGWNKIDDDERARCLEYWLDAELSVPELEAATGKSYSSLRNWFSEDYPRPDKRGRPRKETSYRTTEGLKRKMADGWKPGPKRILEPHEEDQVAKWRDQGLTAPAIVAKIKSEFGKTVSARTVKLTYDRVQSRSNT